MGKFNYDLDYYNQMINCFATAIKYTSKKMHENDFESRLKQVLYDIISKNNYEGITRDYGLRRGMCKFDSTYLYSFICNILKNKYPESFKLLKKDNMSYGYSKDDMIKRIVNCFCDNEFISLIASTPINVDLFSEYQKNSEVRPENIVYYSPSNKCREAILKDTQTSDKSSSAFEFGMYAYSDIGKNRKNQEDSYYIGVHPENSNFKLMVVADGMGGMSSGEIASNIAVRELMLWFESLPASEFYEINNNQLECEIKQVIEHIQKEICKVIFDGGTTICLSIIKNNSIFLATVGDSQGFIIENNKKVYVTTPSSAPKNLGIPRQIARFHTRNNEIYDFLGQRADGTVSYPIKFKEIKLEEGYKYKVILCSDGVSDCLSYEDIAKIANKSKNPAKALVEAAIENDSYLYKELERMTSAQKEKMQEYLKKEKFNYMVSGGKDNTTALETEVEKGRTR